MSTWNISVDPNFYDDNGAQYGRGITRLHNGLSHRMMTIMMMKVMVTHDGDHVEMMMDAMPCLAIFSEDQLPLSLVFWLCLLSTCSTDFERFRCTD